MPIRTRTRIAMYTDEFQTITLTEQHIPYPNGTTRDYIVRWHDKRTRRHGSDSHSTRSIAIRAFEDAVHTSVSMASL